MDRTPARDGEAVAVTGCRGRRVQESGEVTVSASYWTVLLASLGALVYLALKYRSLRATSRDLAETLNRRNTELVEARESLHRLAAIDPVTSLANHSAFQEFLQSEWRRALRDASSISVLMIDVDYFREYNDRLGHSAGDACLAKIGGALKDLVRRPNDLVARYGGKKFGVVLTQADPAGASLVAHRICAAVEALAVPHPESEASSRVTVSVGVSTSTPALDSHWEELALLAGANTALLQAKRAGRNQIAAVESEPGEDGDPEVVAGR
ncbi:MAG: GGDEF domain-containing protein [Acidobacteria bacterium]|nr:GGDEF domain-containing protein [Acidobacteriota bacterium]